MQRLSDEDKWFEVLRSIGVYVPIFRCIFVNEKFCILVQISQKFAFKGPIDNNLALV